MERALEAIQRECRSQKSIGRRGNDDRARQVLRCGCHYNRYVALNYVLIACNTIQKIKKAAEAAFFQSSNNYIIVA